MKRAGGEAKPFACNGMALLTGLVLMAAISLLALVATSSMLLQTRMAANFRDIRQARWASVAAVLRGEAFVLGLEPNQRLPGCLTQCFTAPLDEVIHHSPELPAFPENQDNAWWQDWGIAANGARSRYLVEEIHYETSASLLAQPAAPALDGIGYYRVLGRGSGKGSASVAVSEAIVARPWPLQPLTGQEVVPNAPYCDAFSPWYDCGRVSWRQRR